MSLEKAIEELTVEIRLLRAAIGITKEGSAPATEAANESAAEQPKPAKEKKPAKQEPAAPTLTVDDARVAAMAVTEKCGKAQVKTLLAKHGVEKVSDIKDIAKFVADCNAAAA